MIAYILIAACILLRFVPHMPNFVPVIAVAMFAGAYLPKKIAPWVPLVVMIISDLVIGLHGVVAYTWGAMFLCGVIGIRLKGNRSLTNIFATTVLAALSFFVISNFGVWLAWYPRTVEGFFLCYVKALPFMRNTMAVNISFAFALFGAYALSSKLVEKTRFGKVLLAS